MSEILDNLDVQYTYHVHEGSAGTTANGCYTKKDTIMCYVTSSTVDLGSGKGENNYHGYAGTLGARCPGGEHWYLKRTTYTHSVCGNTTVVDNLSCGMDGESCPHYASFVIQEGSGTSAHLVEIDSYILGCGKTEETVESVTIKY